MISSIEDIVDLHASCGNIEDTYLRLHFDNKVMLLNKYTLRVRRGNATKAEIRDWNFDIYRCVKRDRALTKEIKEFISLFEYLEKARIKSGYIEKSETPDFIITRNGEKTGIEITKIYIGNDWVVDKLNEEIKEFRLRKNELDGYMMYKKYNEKVSTYKLREGLIILPNTKDITIDDYMVELKNKIFTKVRKLSDEYKRFENNIIFVDVVSSDILRNKFDKNEMCRELNFFVSHIESDFARSNVKVVMKLGSEFIEYNLSRGDYNVF